MVTGLRISAGLAIVGIAYSGIAPGFSSPGEPMTLIGGSALITEPRPAPAPVGGLVGIIAARAQDGAAQPPAKDDPVTAKEPISPPTFSKIEIAPDGRIRFAGHGTPGARVTLNQFDRPFASADVTQEGAWTVTVDAPIDAGEYIFSAMAARPDNGSPVAGSDVRIAIPKEFGNADSSETAADAAAAGQLIEANRGAVSQRRRAEQLARDASHEFTEIERRHISALPLGPGAPAAPARLKATSEDVSKSSGAAKKDMAASTAAEHIPGGHVMPEGWRRFAQLYAASRPRADRTSEPSGEDQSAPRGIGMLMPNRRRPADDIWEPAGASPRPQPREPLNNPPIMAC